MAKQILLTLSVVSSLVVLIHGQEQSTVNLDGKYSWQLLFDIDNTQNEGHIERTETIKTVTTVSFSNFKKAIETSSVQAHLGVDVGGVFKVVNIGVKGSVDASLTKYIENMVETKEEKTTTSEKTEMIRVGPKSRLKLYRLVFQGPGIIRSTDTLSSTPHEMENVVISATIQQTPILMAVDVVYTDQAVDQPQNLIREMNGKNPDINAGFSGKFVWLVPIWTAKVREGATSIQLAIQGQENKNYKDLAKGAQGDYRYLKMLREENSGIRISKVELVRQTEAISSPGSLGWQGCTSDLNGGRKGDFLYLCWNTVSI